MREAIATATSRDAAPRGFVLVLPEVPLPYVTHEVEARASEPTPSPL